MASKRILSKFESDADDLSSGNEGGTAVMTPTQQAPMGMGGKINGAPPKAAMRSAYPTEQFAANEVMGDAPIAAPSESGSETGGLHDEVGSMGTESGEEFLEATPEQLNAESGAESALNDLRSIEGFEERESAALGSGGGVTTLLREAGTGTDGGQQEFLPILAALAPTLLSTIGPVVARGIMSRLSGKAKQVLRTLPKPKVVSSTVQTAVTAAGNTAAKILGNAAGKAASGAGAILPILAQLLEQAASSSGGESDMEAPEALIEEAAAAMEVIIGTDDRVRITATTQVPWRRLCALRITFPTGSTYRGTGFLIGPRAVATAGHCVYLHSQGGWARSVEVIPGCNGSTRPYGQAITGALRSVNGWVNQKKPESDYGCIVLPPNSFNGQALGSFGFASFDATALLAQPAVVAGYPGDKPFAELWGMARKIKTVATSTLVYDIDTVGGQSGAPVYITRNGNRYVVGIHNYGASTGNSATRVTPAVFQRLLAWSKL